MATITINGEEEIEIPDQPLTVLVHNQDMELDAKSHVSIDPEATVKTSNELEQDQWELIREHERFRKWWGTLWDDQEPPKVLAKGTLAARHSVGLMLLTMTTVADGKKPFIKYPETYMHPKQQSRLMSLFQEMGIVKPPFQT